MNDRFSAAVGVSRMVNFNRIFAVMSWIIVIATAVATDGQLSRHPQSTQMA